MLCYAMLCYTILDDTIPYHAMPCHAMPYHAIPYHAIPYHTILYYTILHRTHCPHGPHGSFCFHRLSSTSIIVLTASIAFPHPPPKQGAPAGCWYNPASPSIYDTTTIPRALVNREDHAGFTYQQSNSQCNVLPSTGSPASNISTSAMEPTKSQQKAGLRQTNCGRAVAVTEFTPPCRAQVSQAKRAARCITVI